MHVPLGTLCRSLLRWARSPNVHLTPFALDPADFKVDDIFQGIALIRNSIGVQTALIHVFRTLPLTSDNIDLAMGAIRKLNSLNTLLKARKESHDNNLKIPLAVDIYSNTMFIDNAVEGELFDIYL